MFDWVLNIQVKTTTFRHIHFFFYYSTFRVLLHSLSRNCYKFDCYKNEFDALKNLSNNCNLVIQKADKGNSVVIVQKDVYVRHIEKILNDLHKFEKVNVKKGILNFSINHEKCINDYSGSLSSDQYKKIKSTGSRPGILYGLCKVHKAIIDILSTF